jgi:hypothetical protein
MATTPCGTWKITDVPADKVQQTMADFWLQDPKSVTKEEQANGMFTVTAVFEDCPEGEPNTTETSHSDDA